MQTPSQLCPPTSRVVPLGPRREKRSSEAAIRLRERTAQLALTREALQTNIGKRKRAENALRDAERSRELAVVEERNRIAREIHDTVAQALTGVIVQLQAAQDALKKGLPDEADQNLRNATELARDGLGETRRTVSGLRSRALEANDLCMAAENVVKRITAGTQLEATFVVKGVPQPLPSEWDEGVLRIVQESLTNVLRHAEATRFTAELAYDRENLRVTLRDDGCGFDPSRTHAGFGLLGIQERVAKMGGRLAMSSEGGKGTMTVLVLPIASRVGER